jgi:hypothetical protein
MESSCKDSFFNAKNLVLKYNKREFFGYLM